MKGIRRKVVRREPRILHMGGWQIRVAADVLECGHELPAARRATHRACRECAEKEAER